MIQRGQTPRVLWVAVVLSKAGVHRRKDEVIYCDILTASRSTI
jgi:hypothetical protein